MSHEEQAARKRSHTFLEPLNRVEVKMVRRLVEQQKLGTVDQCARERHAAAPASRQRFHFLICG